MTSWLQGLLHWRSASHPRRPNDPASQALDSLIDKGTKLDLVERAGMTRHMQEIAREEMRSVRQLKQKHLGGCKPEDEEMGDIIVGDDIHFHEPPGPPPASRAWPMALGMILGGGLIGGAISLPTILDRLKPAPAAQPQQPANTTINKKIGFILDLPGAEGK